MSTLRFAWRHIVVSTAAKRGTSSANGEYIELPQTRVQVGRGVSAGKNGCSPQRQSAILAFCHFLSHVEEQLAIFLFGLG
jgi:hypothetical protein